MGTTRTDTAYQAVRTDLLSARFKPGQWLKISDLQARFDVSLSVVREALNRLAAEGLLVVAPQRGFRVIDLSLEDLRDLTSARIKIETLVLRDSIRQGDTLWEANLVAAHHFLDRTPLLTAAGRFNRDWLPAHAAFHNALLDGCSNGRMRAIAGTLRDAAEMYRMWSTRYDSSSRDVGAEHRRLMELALARDTERCVELLVEHIEVTQTMLTQSAIASDSAEIA